MAKIIESVLLIGLLLGWNAYAEETEPRGKFVKCSKSSDCRYKLKIGSDTYRVVSSGAEQLDNEVQNIFDELEKQKAAESPEFCVTGKPIIINSKKIKDGSMFKITSIGEIKLKEKTTSAHRSKDAPMGSCQAVSS
jgi:hypothetical protein